MTKLSPYPHITAQVLRELYAIEEHPVIKVVAERLATRFAQESRNFNRFLFLNSCGVQKLPRSEK